MNRPGNPGAVHTHIGHLVGLLGSFPLSRAPLRTPVPRRSALLSPSPRRPSSRSACATQLRIAWAVGSNCLPSADNNTAIHEPALPESVRCEPVRPSGARRPAGTAVSISAEWIPPPQRVRCPRNRVNSTPTPCERWFSTGLMRMNVRHGLSCARLRRASKPGCLPQSGRKTTWFGDAIGSAIPTRKASSEPCPNAGGSRNARTTIDASNVR